MYKQGCEKAPAVYCKRQVPGLYRSTQNPETQPHVQGGRDLPSLRTVANQGNKEEVGESLSFLSLSFFFYLCLKKSIKK